MCCLLLLSQLLPPAAALKFSLFQYKKGRAERGLEEKGRLEALLGENLAKEKDCRNFWGRGVGEQAQASVVVAEASAILGKLISQQKKKWK